MLPQNRPKRKRDAKVFMKDKLGFIELLEVPPKIFMSFRAILQDGVGIPRLERKCGEK
jgi:hypothetical protein